MSTLAGISLFLLAGAALTTPPDEGTAVAALLDRFHGAASTASEEAYFACFAGDAVFLGTDPTERWSVAAFRAYAHEHFAAGRGWTYVPQERHVIVDGGGRVAWFDEVLSNEKYGLCRGTGTCVKGAGGWRIAHYSLTFLVPNAAAAAVREAISGLPKP